VYLRCTSIDYIKSQKKSIDYIRSIIGIYRGRIYLTKIGAIGIIERKLAFHWKFRAKAMAIYVATGRRSSCPALF